MTPIERRTLRDAYRWCRRLTRNHRENFPVASLLVAPSLRDPLAAIYAFARCADDIADDASLPPGERHRRLQAMRQALHAPSGQGHPQPVFLALRDTRERYALPHEPFEDLLDAFLADCETTRYADFNTLMRYCRRSANPVGRLLLHLLGHYDARRAAWSDAICSALQLIDFVQDVASDYRRHQRIYLPADELSLHSVSVEDIAQARDSAGLTRVKRIQLQRAARLLQAGSPLAWALPPRYALELRVVLFGAARLLEKLFRQPAASHSVQLRIADRAAIACRALGARRAPSRLGLLAGI